VIPAVVIVEDETDVADTCVRVLKRAGFECLVAYDSPEALALVDSGLPEVVLCDINLPTHDGFEVARYVRRKRPDTPVILMTSYYRRDIAGRAVQVGAAHCLCKPFSNSELISTVESLLAER
jgi:DNA-binding response OmpR family regulator